MSEVHIYQIFYSEQSRLEIDPGFLGLDNMTNLRPDWREYWPIRNCLLNNTLDDNDYYGFFSPKFRTKTNLDSSTVHNFLDNYAGEADVFLFSPFFDLSAYTLNVFEQGMAQHKNIDEAVLGSVAKIAPTVDLSKLVMDSRNTVFCNYFVARPSFWKDWLISCEIIFSEAEENKTLLATFLNSGTNHDGSLAPNKVFIIERIASLLLSTQRKWKVKAYNPMQLPFSSALISKYPDELAQLDALKIASTILGFPEYINTYYKLRESISEKINSSISSN